MESLLLTELLFENLLSDLSPPELAAVLSVMIFERGDSEEVTVRNLHLKTLENQMVTIMRRIITLEKECGLPVELTDDLLKTAVPVGFMEIAFNWCRGLPFAEVMNGTKLAEGFVVNQLLRTVQICRKLGSVANEIGNPPLSQKCEEVCQAMLRDIVYTPSLYLAEDS